MKNIAYILIFDGFADWEPALALCEIRGQNKFDIVSAGFSKKTVTSMGGLKIIPDIIFPEIDAERAALLILPGGNMWEEGEHKDLNAFLISLNKKKIPIAAICAATLTLAKSGLLHGNRHTSNSMEYLKAMFPGYGDETSYVDSPVISDNGLITAGGADYVEFACEILKILGIYGKEELDIWYNLFKHGILPPGAK